MKKMPWKIGDYYTYGTHSVPLNKERPLVVFKIIELTTNPLRIVGLALNNEHMPITTTKDLSHMKECSVEQARVFAKNFLDNLQTTSATNMKKTHEGLLARAKRIHKEQWLMID
jgi:hypothetical protein